MMPKEIIIGRISNIGSLTLTEKNGSKYLFIRFSVEHSVLQDGKENYIQRSMIAYKKTAETISKNLHIGDLCCIEGYTNPDTKSVVVERIVFLSGRKKEVLSVPKEINTL